MNCRDCGVHVELWGCVMLCDDCIDKRVEEKPCHTCGAMAKYHPRMSRIYDGSAYDDEGKLKPPRYWCADHTGDALL